MLNSLDPDLVQHSGYKLFANIISRRQNISLSGNMALKCLALSNNLDPDQARHFVGPGLGQTVCEGYQQMTLGGAELLDIVDRTDG